MGDRHQVLRVGEREGHVQVRYDEVCADQEGARGQQIPREVGGLSSFGPNGEALLSFFFRCHAPYNFAELPIVLAPWLATRPRSRRECVVRVFQRMSFLGHLCVEKGSKNTQERRE